MITCHCHVWVQLDDRVKQAVRPYWEELIKLDCEHNVQLKRAQYADRLSRQWTTILEKLADNPVAGGAAQMPEEEFAAVVERLLSEQQERLPVYGMTNRSVGGTAPLRWRRHR